MLSIPTSTLDLLEKLDQLEGENLRLRMLDREHELALRQAMTVIDKLHREIEKREKTVLVG